MFGALRTVTGALTTPEWIAESAIGAAIVVLAITLLIVVLLRRRRTRTTGRRSPEVWFQTPGLAMVTAGATPTPGHLTPSTAPMVGAYAMVPADDPPAPLLVPSPGPGVPASWLCCPSGKPGTLRYWDGRAWTHHIAERSAT